MQQRITATAVGDASTTGLVSRWLFIYTYVFGPSDHL